MKSGSSEWSFVNIFLAAVPELLAHRYMKYIGKRPRLLFRRFQTIYFTKDSVKHSEGKHSIARQQGERRSLRGS